MQDGLPPGLQYVIIKYSYLHKCNKCKKTFINAFVAEFLANICKRWTTNVEY